MPDTYVIQQLAKIASEFVVKKQGVWNHQEWEQLCAEISGLGLDLNGEMQMCLGVLIETFKVFYDTGPKKIKKPAAEKSKSPVKRTAKSKPVSSSEKGK